MRHRAGILLIVVASSQACDSNGPPPPPAAADVPATVGLFDDRTSTLPDAARLGMRSMEARAADFDADGDLDAIVVAEDDKAKDFYVNDGKAHFTNASDRLP
jgi:hypothetical protein